MMRRVLDLTGGIDVGQADALYLAGRALEDGEADELILSDGLADAFGTPINAKSVVALLIINRPRSVTMANETELVVGGCENARLSATIGEITTPAPPPFCVIPPGGFLMLGADGRDGLGKVVPTSADVLRVANQPGGPNTIKLRSWPVAPSARAGTCANHIGEGGVYLSAGRNGTGGGR